MKWTVAQKARMCMYMFVHLVLTNVFVLSYDQDLFDILSHHLFDFKNPDPHQTIQKQCLESKPVFLTFKIRINVKMTT